MILLTGEKGCLTDDTIIYTNKNPKGIEIKKLIAKGPIKVLSYNTKKFKYEYKLSGGVEFAKYDYVYEVKFSNNKIIKCTGDHPFLLTTGKYKILRSIEEKDEVCCEDFNTATIVYTRQLGKQNVYDVVNVRDNHNFIANGFIVSNTGKSSAAIMIARYWCRLLGKPFIPEKNIAYNDKDVQNKIENLEPFSAIVCDEAIRFCLSSEWAKRSHRELRKSMGQIRTKHFLFILCFPLKVYKLESSYLQSYVNYWVDIYARSRSVIYIKNANPTQDAWSLKEFDKTVGAYNEFTSEEEVKKKLMKHPNFWQTMKIPRVPEKVYAQYLVTREKNVYNETDLLSSISKEDAIRALLILALRDIMTNDTTLSMNRIILHIKNQYDININKAAVQTIVEDSKQLISKVRETIIDGNLDESYKSEYNMLETKKDE
jgi:hypothetical protein